MTTGIHYMMHIGICVADLERSIRFYRDGLGFRESGDLTVAGEPTATMLDLPSDMHLDAVYLDREGFRIELLSYPRPGTVGEAKARPMNQLGLTHFAFRVDDLDAAIARVEAHGGALIEGSRIQNEEFGSDLCYVTDPDGVRLELVQVESDPTRPD
ncbi:MAG: VOC family protein [bacterium]|nr:VOC family protein [bacterium]